MSVLLSVRCRGCGRVVGYSSQSRAVPIFCTDPYCALVPAGKPTDDRDSLIYLMHARGVVNREIAQVFDLSFQRAHQLGSTP